MGLQQVIEKIQFVCNILACIGVMLVLNISPLKAEQIRGSYYSYGNWSGAAYTNDRTGAFSHCTVSAAYKSGDSLFFSVNRSATVSVGVASPAIRQLSPGSKVPVSIYVDRRPPFFGTATVISEDFAVLEIAEFQRALDSFKKGYTLVVEGGGLRGVYDLTGTFRALSKALNCAQTYYNYASKAPEANTSSNDKTRTFQLASMIISELGIKSFRFLSPEELQKKNWQNTVAWVSPELGISGLSLIMPRSQVDNLRQTDPQDTQWLASACDGDYAASSRGVDTQSGAASVREIRLLCDTEAGASELFLSKMFSGNEIVYTMLRFDAGFSAPSTSYSPNDMSEQAALVAARYAKQ